MVDYIANDQVPLIRMRKNNLHILFNRKYIFSIFLLLLFFAVSTSVTAQKNPPPKETNSPPTPPPPPPIPESYSGPGSTLSSTTLKKIETLKSIFGQRLTNMSLNGNRENDFLVRVMQLNYGAINNVADAGLGGTATNDELTKQTNLFLEANALLPPNPKEDTSAGSAILKNSIQKRGLGDIKDELIKISEEYKLSGMDPSVLSFATKIIKESGKKADS